MAKKPKTKPSNNVGGIDLADVDRLLGFMERHGLEEFEYARGGVHIRLKKPAKAMVAAPWSSLPAEAPRGPAAPPAAPGHSRSSEAAVGADLHVIKSPIVGTFYGAPSPGAEPFVTAGAKVDAGQVLCIIEAMKLMNEIESDVAGELVEIYAENGKPVEYGEPLFGIRVSGRK